MRVEQASVDEVIQWQRIATQAAAKGFSDLLVAASGCHYCVPRYIPKAYPVFEIDAEHRPKIIIASQAPGRIAHETKLTFNDPSGDRLRDWMGVSRDEFYDTKNIAIVPMGFCYPGKAKTGDKPPIKECQTIWHDHFFKALGKNPLILSVGSYSQAWHLAGRRKRTLTETVLHYQDYLKLSPSVLPIPHPSPLNNIWLKRNPWFEDRVLPDLKVIVDRLLR